MTDECFSARTGVNIPEVFKAYNNAAMYGDEQRARMFYSSWLDENEGADPCIESHEYLEKCPQGIKIPDWLKKAHEMLHQEETPAA